MHQFRGLADAVGGIKSRVERERREAWEREHGLQVQLGDEKKEAKTVQKELSLQLRVAGRSYETLLTATRELSEQIRIEEEKRLAEVAPLKVEIKHLKSQLSVIEKPWKEEVAKRDLNIMKLQQTIAPLEQKVRDEKMKLPPIIEKFKAEIKVREEATECVLKEVQLWKVLLAERMAAAALELQQEKDRAAREIEPVRAELEALKKVYAVATDPFKKQIKELKYIIEQKDNELAQVDYSPYEKLIEIKNVAYYKLVRDFEVKENYNRENQERMREAFEQVILRMEKKMQDLERERDKAQAPFEEKIEWQAREIEKRDKRLNAIKEEIESQRRRLQDHIDEMSEELKSAKQAMNFGASELLKAKRTMQAHLDEYEGDQGPSKRMRMMELKLNDVVERCQAVVRAKDLELSEKTQVITGLQGALLAKAELLAEFDRSWNKRIQVKEEGYLRASAELAYAEGQIVEERKRTAEKVEIIKAREKDIILLRGEHTEELKLRLRDREELEQFIKDIQTERLDESVMADEQIRKLQEEPNFLKMRWQADVDDLRVEVARRDKALVLVEKELEQVREQYDKAKICWGDKERELGAYIRTRDRHITGLKNEMEFINDSWEIKYNNLLALFEKLQKKYDEVVGPNGILEAHRRNKDLKDEIRILKTEIEDLKEQVKKQKRRIRDMELRVDEVMKETADILSEKEIGIAKMVGERAQLQQKYNDLQNLLEEMKKETDQAMVAMAESFESRIEELEQLCEAMRFTDREVLIERIKNWKKSYERVCLERDEIDEAGISLVETKELQILAMAQENNEVNVKKYEAISEMTDKMKEVEKKWSQKILVANGEIKELEEKLLKLQLALGRANAAATMASLMVNTKDNGEEVAELKRLLEEKDNNLKELEKGIGMIVEANRELTQKVEAPDVDVDAIHESYVPKLAEKERMIKRMEAEHSELKEIMEVQLYAAQQACRAIEERVRKFPNPFEIEIREMRDKYAQMQAGMLKLQLDNVNLSETINVVKELKDEEIQYLDKQLQSAVDILKQVASLDVLDSMSKEQVAELEGALGIDLDGDRKIDGETSSGRGRRGSGRR